MLKQAVCLVENKMLLRLFLFSLLIALAWGSDPDPEEAAMDEKQMDMLVRTCK